MTANRKISVIAVGAALVLVVAWFFLLWSPESKSLKSAHKAHAAADQKVSDLQTQVGQLEGLVKQIPADNAAFAQLQQQLPDNPQLDQTLNLMHQAALQNAVTIATLTPSQAASGSGPSSSSSSGSQASGPPAVTLTISAIGPFNQLKAFVGALSKMSRTVVIDRVSISGVGNSAANITARIFYAGQPSP